MIANLHDFFDFCVVSRHFLPEKRKKTEKNRFFLKKTLELAFFSVAE